LIPELSPLLVVLGPTGSGKSELSLDLAEALGGEIVGCDSVQVHRGLDIGSAKLRLESRRGIPHHLLDVVGPAEDLTAGSYARLARSTLADIRDRHALPIVVGGTGFYLRALLDGLSPAPHRDDRLRRRLQARATARPNLLHRFLRRFDREASQKIHPNDRQKLIRAVELILLSGRRAARTEMEEPTPLTGFNIYKVGLNPARPLLNERLNERCEWMFCCGLVEETEALLRAGVPPDGKAIQSLGYKQARQYLAGQITLPEAIHECSVKTRQYAKRQVTWFRAEKDVHWFSGFGTDLSVKQAVLEAVRSQFGSGVPHVNPC
jgi:tRNA dimethylallyltransferase